MPCFSVAADYGGEKTVLIQYMISELEIRKSYIGKRGGPGGPRFKCHKTVTHVCPNLCYTKMVST